MRFTTATASVLLAGAMRVSAQVTGEDAVLVLENGRVHTSAGIAEAIAVDERGLILAVGTDDEVAGYKLAARVIDLQGRTVLPGLHDMHVHAISGGVRQFQCNFAPGAAMATVLDAVAACAEESEEGEWILGGSWDAPALGEPPRRELLDGVAPNNPVLLRDTSGHGRWANSAALAEVGYDENTPDPDDGIIERDTDGRPTGVLLERAGYIAQSKVPPISNQRLGEALAWSLEELLTYGVTSITEASVGITATWERELRAWAMAADDGTLKQRTRLCLTFRPAEGESAEAMLEDRNRYERNLLRPDCVKLYLDGVPTDSHTAAMLEPYIGTETQDEANRRGLLLIEQGQLSELVARFDGMGLAVKMHAAGDASSRAALDAIEHARTENGFSGLMHSVAHSTFVTPEDMPRAREIGATFDVSPYLWAPAPINDSIAAAVGEERVARAWPVRELIDAGALVVPGSDWPVIPSVNPWIGIETMVTRQKPGGSDETFGLGEAVTLEEAVRLYTTDSARQKGMSHRIGALDRGMMADMIVLQRDPFKVPIEDVHETTVDFTIIGGKIAYER